MPWASGLDNEEQRIFRRAVEKTKTATIFHLLGWEAAIASNKVLTDGIHSLAGFSYHSPRGTVHFHPQTHFTYAPLYKGRITGNREGKCELRIEESMLIDAGEHEKVMRDRPTELASGWKNNYLCI